MLTIQLMGGLGNQLFQIATAYAYAKRHGLNLILPKSWETRADRQPLWDSYLDPQKFSLAEESSIRAYPWQTILERGFLYSPLPPPAGLPFIKLFGYFQSALYFYDYANEVRSLLQVPSLLKAKADAVLEVQGILDPQGWIGAHVRRGDYLVEGARAYHEVTTPTYFKAARAHIETALGEKRGVCWITEDPEWVYRTLYREGDKVFCNESTTDFALLASFEHLILSNSSFSWWAAWLNPSGYQNRRICVPSKWFGPTGHQNCETIYEDGWMRTDPTSGNLLTQP
jgi:hypothetical protein